MSTPSLVLPAITKPGGDEDHQNAECDKPVALIPRLAPLQMVPEHWSMAAVPLSHLRQIERVAIREAHVRDGITFYTVDVFVHQPRSRLPTVVRRERASSIITAADSANTMDNAMASYLTRKPDYQLERRFSDFVRLREYIQSWLCMNPMFTCEYCNEVSDYLKFKWHQPRSFIKVFTGTDARKRILERFMNDFIELAQYKARSYVKCEGHERVPALVHAFVGNEEQTNDASNTENHRDPAEPSLATN
ncbi:TPA: hypothetical protein N0F65_002724 [Lagenidium giganteum]|uniref:PX domain-containing protein n=1 Tax=Lagenidium giganteum TaxID=4803 RepID=A0AAV2Z2F5_9STRA|nr:TPA: hypothetical protein N0F65_002724 [Lagenidium giganteum]